MPAEKSEKDMSIMELAAKELVAESRKQMEVGYDNIMTRFLIPVCHLYSYFSQPAWKYHYKQPYVFFLLLFILLYNVLCAYILVFFIQDWSNADNGPEVDQVPLLLGRKTQQNYSTHKIKDKNMKNNLFCLSTTLCVFNNIYFLANAVPEGFETDENLDVSLRAEQSSLDDYESIPVDKVRKGVKEIKIFWFYIFHQTLPICLNV